MRSPRLVSGFTATAILLFASVGFVGAQSDSTSSARRFAPRPGREQGSRVDNPSDNAAFPLLLTPARALAFVQAVDRNLDYVRGEVLVKFKEGVDEFGQQRALTAIRSGPSVRDIHWIGQVALLRDQTEMDSTILAAQLGSQPEVEYAEPNYIRHSNLIPNDPGFTPRQWNMTAIDMPRAWDINPGGKDNVTVAVVDTGITTVNESFTFQTWNGQTVQNISVPFKTNPDLASSRVVTPKDFIFWDGPVVDMVGHGTHVASTIGEDTNNSLGDAGIAYHSKIMPVKVCVGYWEVQFALTASGFRGFVPLDVGGCDDADVAQGVRYAADNGAKVINLSLGGPEASNTLKDALAYAVSKGAFVSISAGNAHDGDNPVEYPAGYAPDFDGVMSVGAVGPSLTRAHYSNTGAYVEIAAPGGSDRESNGFVFQGTLLPTDYEPGKVIAPRFDRYAEVGYVGTSMAAPHVAGTAALVISQGVTRAASVEALIKKTARDLGAAGRDDEYGFGLIQPRAALFGFGIAR